MAEHAIDKKLIEGPVTELCGDPNDRKAGPGVFNGEPGWPARSGSSDALPEKTLDSAGDFGKAGRGEG